MKQKKPFIITIDGPAGAGKGTLAHKIADHFSYAFLDTGLLYRAVAFGMLTDHADLYDADVAHHYADALNFDDLNNVHLRDEGVSQAASIIAVYPEVRNMLLQFQRNTANAPPGDALGIVVDGRDIGSFVLPEAPCKFYVTADLCERARRRFMEMQTRGSSVTYDDIYQDMLERDMRDTSRATAPLRKACDALLLDTTHLSIEEVFLQALSFVEIKQK